MQDPFGTYNSNDVNQELDTLLNQLEASPGTDSYFSHITSPQAHLDQYQTSHSSDPSLTNGSTDLYSSHPANHNQDPFSLSTSLEHSRTTWDTLDNLYQSQPLDLASPLQSLESPTITDRLNPLHHYEVRGEDDQNNGLGQFDWDKTLYPPNA